MGIAIKVENLSKAYQLGEIGTGTLSRDLERYWAKLRGKEDPFLRIGETNDRSQKGESDIVWSLKNINFEIEQGDAVGIIGRNGAGKSTLLKILSRVTSPTTGSVKVKGRVASLLEVGTGFHPELTGRENIYINGAILGMRKKEIKQKFDEIVDFAGVERYIDTPVKRYSSGMYVRLAFAVAAHLESEILVVDEVLAVGDAEFQKKCLGKMNDVSKGEGRTILFVSHNMNSIKRLCMKGMVLKNGYLDYSGYINDSIKVYETIANTQKDGFWKNNDSHIDSIQLLNITIKNSRDLQCSTFDNSEFIIVEFFVKCIENCNNIKLGFDLIKNEDVVFRSQQIDSINLDSFVAGQEYKFKCEIPAKLLNIGTYTIRPLLSIHCERSLINFFEGILEFKILLDYSNSKYHSILNEANHPGQIFPILKWSY